MLLNWQLTCTHLSHGFFLRVVAIRHQPPIDTKNVFKLFALCIFSLQLMPLYRHAQNLFYLQLFFVSIVKMTCSIQVLLKYVFGNVSYSVVDSRGGNFALKNQSSPSSSSQPVYSPSTFGKAFRMLLQTQLGRGILFEAPTYSYTSRTYWRYATDLKNLEN